MKIKDLSGEEVLPIRLAHLESTDATSEIRFHLVFITAQPRLCHHFGRKVFAITARWANHREALLRLDFIY